VNARGGRVRRARAAKTTKEAGYRTRVFEKIYHGMQSEKGEFLGEPGVGEIGDRFKRSREQQGGRSRETGGYSPPGT